MARFRVSKNTFIPLLIYDVIKYIILDVVYFRCRLLCIT
jgi:hypothetical protein